MKFAIGARVRVVDEIGRQSVVVEIRTNRQGTILYILKDGGWFGESEIELLGGPNGQDP